MVTITVGLVALLLALDQVPEGGWGDPRILGLMALFSIGIVPSFVERLPGARAGAAGRSYATVASPYSCAAVLFISACFAMMLYLPQYMLKVLDFTPIQTGADGCR